MSRKTAAVMLFIILDAFAFAVGVWITFGHDLWHVVRIDMIRRILFLAALQFPLLFVFRHFRDRYGVDMAHFCMYSLLPPFCVLVIASVVLYAVAAATADGWGGLAVMGLIVTLYGITFVLLFIAFIWIYAGQLFENIKRSGVRKAFSVILLILGGAAIGNGLYIFVFPHPSVNVSSVYTSNFSPYIAITLYKAAVEAVPVGIGLAALGRYYRDEYSLKLPIFLLCAFAPTFLSSILMAWKVYLDSPDYYLDEYEFFDRVDNLLFAAAILVMTVIIYAIFSAIRRKKSY